MRKQNLNEPLRFGCRIAEIVEEQNAGMRVAGAEDQRAHVAILGYEHAFLRESLAEQSFVARIFGAFGHVQYVMTRKAHGLHRLGNDVRICEQPHPYSAAMVIPSSAATSLNRAA